LETTRNVYFSPKAALEPASHDRRTPGDFAGCNGRAEVTEALRTAAAEPRRNALVNDLDRCPGRKRQRDLP
jgi:hypothetical protein